MYQCVRQTNINFHISSNYRYKANALEVFSAFRETSSSEESKDRITEQVVSYIYTTDDSGFITSKDKDIKIEGLDALAKFK
jgi:predicted NUDIX family phosphoesterase